MTHDPEWYTAAAWLMRRRLRLAARLVDAANRLVRAWTEKTPAVWPMYRAVDTAMPEITGSKWHSGAYSYENLKSLVEQDGPDGFGATATVRWLLSEEGIVELKDLSHADLKAMFAANDIEISTPQKIPSIPWWRRVIFAG